LPVIEKVLDIRRHEVGVRIPDHPVPISLINTLKHPLYSITAKRSMTGKFETFAKSEDDGSELPSILEDELFESAWELEDINGVDLILDTGEERERISSTILDMCDNEIKVLRKGAGPWPA
jgi:tRNA A37 threonylcarbamoyladenosine synthetase subunit TsaC/SUA5/YrdC